MDIKTKKYKGLLTRTIIFILVFVSLTGFIGATTMEQLKENIASIDIELNKEVLEQINAVHAAIPNPAP